MVSTVSQIDVSADVLKRDGITANEEVVVDVAPYLPEGVNLVDEAAGSVVVTISVEKAGAKTLALPVRSVKVNNAPEEFELTYDGGQTVNLQFEGANDVLEGLTVEKIIATIDLAEYKEAGTYEVPVQVIDLPEQCVYLGGATIQITLTRK